MAKSSSIILFLAFCLFFTAVIIDASNGSDHGLSFVPAKFRCQGSIAECMAEDEYDMDSEINRRILATTKYISYGALQRNTVPCSQRGASYYNCKPGAQANPYNRGCSAITRCRS
ncbi:hypothetical protein ACLB2K_019389 [Fragaria x ananassa]